MSRASLGFLLAVSLVIALFLVSCAPQITDRGRQPADGRSPTATPTPLPTSTPRPTETPTPIPTPAPPEHPAIFDYAFSRGLIRFDPARSQWLVSAVQTADGQQTADGGRQTADFILLPGTFATNDELAAKNPLAPLTLRALDENGQEMTLIYNPASAEFRIAYSFPALFEGIGTDNPRLIEENLDAIPFIPIEDIQSGLAAQSVLLAMQKDGYQPFGEETAQNFGAGYLLRFTMPNNNLKLADLTSYSIHSPDTDTLSELIVKASPYWIRTDINGKTYDVPALVLLNPQDPQNPRPDEFLVIFAIPHADEVISLTSPNYDVSAFYNQKNPYFPGMIHLYAEHSDGTPLDPNSPNILESTLSQLLGIEGNDASKLEYVPGYLDLQVNINQGIKDLGTLGNILEMPLAPDILPPELQQMILPFEVGVAQ